MMQEILTVYGVKIAAALAVLLTLVVLLFRQNREQPQGMISVEEKIKRLGDEYVVVNDVVLPGFRGMNRIDHVVVSPFGVFVVTVRCQTGKVRGEEGDREWEVKSGRSRDTIYNPLWDNRKQMNALEETLGRYPYVPVVVFTQAKLKGAFPENVVPLNRLPGFLRKYRKQVLFSDKQQAVLEKLRVLKNTA